MIGEGSIIKESKDLMSLMDRYILGKGYSSRKEYLKEAEEKGLVKNINTANAWIRGLCPFNLATLKGFADDLDIPLEEIVGVYGRDPFKPPIQEIKQDQNPIGKLIDWYINLKTGKTRNKYLKKAKEKGLIKSTVTANEWISGRVSFPPHELKLLTDNLGIPYDEINQFVNYDIWKV